MAWLRIWMQCEAAIGLSRIRRAARTIAFAPALAVALTSLAAPAPARAATETVSSVARVGMTVSDMDRALAFYEGVLTFEKISEVEVAGEEYERLQGVFGLRLRVVRLRLGAEEIELLDYIAPEGRAIPADSRSNDLWFQHIAIVVSDMEKAYAHLRAHKVEHASSGPQLLPAWNPNAGGIEAFYFKDPDHHVLEVIRFPAGKGDPRWQESAGALFLGIDHTAVVVDDAEASLRFYRDRLGFRVAGESENYGMEQERLNNVFGARLRIIGLKAASGPGVELLDYLAPATGRARPADAAGNDLLHWQTTFVIHDAAGAAARLSRAGVAFVSPGVVTLGRGELGYESAFQIQDPDGHVVQLVEGETYP